MEQVGTAIGFDDADPKVIVAIGTTGILQKPYFDLRRKGEVPRSKIGTDQVVELASKIPRRDFHASESDHPQEIFDVVLVARDQSAKHLQPGEQALDCPPPPIAA